MDTKYSIELSLEILKEKDTSLTSYIPIKSNDKEFIKYKDDYIEIISAKNTKAMNISIFSPLTTGTRNPIICIDDHGECYRSHGERIFFILYVERLLDKEKTLFLNDYLKHREDLINSLFT